MKFNRRAYIAIGIVLSVSVLALLLLPVNELAQAVIASPIAVALIAALYQIIRDEAAHQKKRELQQEQNDFTVSVSSQMAATAFAKHVAFCEDYINEINKGMPNLYADGPSTSSRELSEALRKVRLKHSTWVTKDIRSKLTPFEDALFKIGLNREFITDFPKEKKMDLIHEMHDLFADVLELQKKKREEKGGTEEQAKEIGATKVIEKVQDILGIAELTELRIKVIKQANKSVDTTQVSAPH